MIELLLVALSLAMDAMAVSVTNGIKLKKCRKRDAVEMGVFFGVFQFIMPLLGFFLGGGILSHVGKMAPYISFVILFFLGSKMVLEARKCEGGVCECAIKEKLTFTELTLQAIATSIDALAVGFALSGTASGEVLFNSLVIGVVAFICSFIGAMAGRKLGDLFEKWAETVGGFILIGIGLKILIESFIG